MTSHTITKVKIAGLLILLVLLLYVTKAAELDFGTNESTVQSFYNAREETIDMADKGLPVMEAFYLANQGEIILRSGNYPELQEVTEDINSINRRVNNIFITINKIRIKISELNKKGYNFSPEEAQLNKAVDAFEIENYEDAELYLRKLNTELNSIVLNNSALLENNLNELYEMQKKGSIEIDLVEELINSVIRARKEKDYAYLIQTANELEDINDSIIAVLNINEKIARLAGKGRKTTRMDDLRLEIIDALQARDYETVALINSEIEYLWEIINNTEELLSATRTKIQEMPYLEGIDKVNETLELSIIEFNNENYEDAEELVQDSYDLLNRLDAQSLLFGAVSVDKLRFNLVKAVSEDPQLMRVIILTIILLILLYNKTAGLIMIKLYTKRIAELEKEQKVINSAVKKSQVEYYVKQMIDKETYRTIVAKHQERLIKINERVPVLKDRINRIKTKKKIFK